MKRLGHAVAVGLAGLAGAACIASCSGNGRCVEDACACAAGWRGADCGALDVVADRAVALWPPPERIASTSSWGGTVVADEGGRHRIFVSEMAGGCGLATWRTNSMIVSAASRSGGPLGPYKKASEVLVPPFGHNAQMIRKTARSPWILMHIGGYDHAPKRGCRGGITPAAGGRRLAAAGAKRSRPALGSRVLYADALDGPWNETVLRCGPAHANCDFANPSMAVDPETGAALAAYKVIHGPRRGQAISFATAPTWRGPFEPVSDRWNAKPAIPCGTTQ